MFTYRRRHQIIHEEEISGEFSRLFWKQKAARKSPDKTFRQSCYFCYSRWIWIFYHAFNFLLWGKNFKIFLFHFLQVIYFYSVLSIQKNIMITYLSKISLPKHYEWQFLYNHNNHNLDIFSFINKNYVSKPTGIEVE